MSWNFSNDHLGFKQIRKVPQSCHSSKRWILDSEALRNTNPSKKLFLRYRWRLVTHFVHYTFSEQFSTTNRQRHVSSSTGWVSWVCCATCARLRRPLDAGKYSTCWKHAPGSYAVVTPENSDAPGATGAVSAQQEFHWSAEVASKIGIIIVGCYQF